MPTDLDVADCLRKLEWLSSSARSIIVARFLLRSLSAIGSELFVTPRGEEFLLSCLRSALLALSRPGEGSVFSPIKPSLDPDSVGLSRRRNKVDFSFRFVGNGKAEWTFGNSKVLWTDVLSDRRGNNDSLQALIEDTDRVYGALRLNDRKIADQQAIALRSQPLANVESTPQWLPAARELFRQAEQFSGGDLKFWSRWFEGFAAGNPLDWELQHRIALIAEEDWELGPAQVARKIEEIEAQYLSERLPQAERIEINPDTGKFRAIPIPVAKPDLLGATLSLVGDALDDALANPSNGLTERSREARVLRRTITKYGNDPQRIEMDFVSVAQGLRRQIDQTDELPKSEENLALLSSVEQGALGIRATHPEVAENREILAQQALRELSSDDKDLLADAAPLLEAISEDVVAEDFATDIPELINDTLGPVPRNAPPLPGVTRTFSRVSKMKQGYDRLVSAGARVFDSKEFKTVRLTLTVGTMFTSLIALGLRILGVF